MVEQVKRRLEDLAVGWLRMTVTRVRAQGMHMEYATHDWFGGLSLKTTGRRVPGLGLKTQAEVPRRNRAAHGFIARLARGEAKS
jgi:hypothetical protein